MEFILDLTEGEAELLSWSLKVAACDHDVQPYPGPLIKAVDVAIADAKRREINNGD